MGSSASSAAIKAIQIPLTLLATLGLNEDIYPEQTPLKNNTEFEFIVVGSGTAGTIVATRLVEADNSVMLLEAGDDPPISALFAALFVTLPKSVYDYDYRSTFDPYAAQGQGNYTTFTSGRMLGGSASMNHLIHTRGCPCEFDRWACNLNDNTWNYENLLPYFIKSERAEDKEIINAYPKYHGTDGPTGLTRELSADATVYLNSFKEAGHDTVLDLNADKAKGYTQPFLIIAEQIRQTPAYSYLKRIKNDKKLYLSKSTRVTKILFEGNVAIGVEAVHKGVTYVFRAKKEVIVSAGVYNSPQLLMLSGIGPEEHLKAMDIDVKANLSVGNNFIEQVSTMITYKTKKYLLPILDVTSILKSPTKVPFPVIAGNAALNNSQACPDYQTFVLLFPHDIPFITLVCHDTFWYRSDICDKLQKDVIGRDTMFTLLANVNPKSRGTVRLKSTNPFEQPIIKTNFYGEEEDLENMVKYVKDFIKVGKSKYFKKVGAKLAGLDVAGCGDIDIDSDDFWRCYVKNLSCSPYHAVGTCPIGSVVDSNLGVIGFERLRVVDASVMPTSPLAAPYATVIAIAEKAVDLIKSGPNY